MPYRMRTAEAGMDLPFPFRSLADARSRRMGWVEPTPTLPENTPLRAPTSRIGNNGPGSPKSRSKSAQSMLLFQTWNPLGRVALGIRPLLLGAFSCTKSIWQVLKAGQ